MSSLSIITVCLNEAGRIEQTLESVASQSWGAYEWIVVDGGSTDGTLDVVRRFGDRISTLISEDDRGIFHAMNKGVLRATREYLLFLNAGDRLHGERTLETAVPHLSGADVLVGDMLVTGKGDGEPQHKRYENVSFDRHFLYERTLPHQATFIRRDLFTRYGLYDEGYRFLGDHEFFARTILRHGVEPGHIPVLVSVYPLDGVTARMKHSPEFADERRRIRRKHFPLWYRLARSWQGSKPGSRRAAAGGKG